LSGGTAIHFAAQNGHTRCVRLLVADYVPSISEFWNIKSKQDKDFSTSHFFDEVYVPLLVYNIFFFFAVTSVLSFFFLYFLYFLSF
jgi:hypothetical protein